MHKTLIVLIGLVSAFGASARTLTSADGSKVIEAEIRDYNPNTDKVEIRQEGSDRNVELDASSFSVRDRVYFHDYLKEATKRNALKISVSSESERFKTGVGSIYVYFKNKEFYTIKVANTGVVDLEKLTAKYDIYASKYTKKGDKELMVISGESAIDSLPAAYTDEFVSKTVEITRSCVTTSSCPKCKTHAASVKRDRIVGIHVHLHDEKGELITEFFSSNGIKTLAAKNSSGS